jgi:hypothetical protein
VGDEETMNGNGRYRTQMPDVAGSVSAVTNNVIELSELQAQLLKLELKKSTRKARTCLIVAIIAICLLLASIPVALLALAELLVDQLDWSRPLAVGVAALIGLLLSAIFAGVAYAIQRSGLMSLQQSHDELKRNLAWIKSALRNRSEYQAATKP